MSTGVSNEGYRLRAVNAKWASHACGCGTLRKYRPGHDSFANVLKNQSFLKALEEGRDVVYGWDGEANCKRLYAFYVYATKYHSLLSTATHCGLRRFFMTMSMKVREFHACFQQVRAAGWDWSVVHGGQPWCPGGVGHRGHCIRVMAQHMDTLVTLYKPRPSHEQTLMTQLEQHMCPDLASLVLSYYRNDHAT